MHAQEAEAPSRGLKIQKLHFPKRCGGEGGAVRLSGRGRVTSSFVRAGRDYVNVKRARGFRGVAGVIEIMMTCDCSSELCVFQLRGFGGKWGKLLDVHLIYSNYFKKQQWSIGV